jgi:hypothetical protein
MGWHTRLRRLLILLAAGATVIGLAWWQREPLRGWLSEALHATLNRLRPPAPAVSLTREANRILEVPTRVTPAPSQIPPQVPAGTRVPARYRFSSTALARYQAWIRETLDAGGPALIVDKWAHTLDLYRDGQKLATFPIDLGGNPVDDKFMEGDQATPEGRYRIAEVRDRGRTRFYRGYLLDYPRPRDREELARLKRDGLARPEDRPGGLIMVHGKGGLGVDWTLGCMALANRDMDRLFAHGLQVGTPVTIVRYGTRALD